MAAINLGMRRWRPRPQSASTPTISPSWFFTTRFGAVMWPTHLGEQMHRRRARAVLLFKAAAVVGSA